MSCEGEGTNSNFQQVRDVVSDQNVGQKVGMLEELSSSGGRRRYFFLCFSHLATLAKSREESVHHHTCSIEHFPFDDTA